MLCENTTTEKAVYDGDFEVYADIYSLCFFWAVNINYFELLMDEIVKRVAVLIHFKLDFIRLELFKVLLFNDVQRW